MVTDKRSLLVKRKLRTRVVMGFVEMNALLRTAIKDSLRTMHRKGIVFIELYKIELKVSSRH